MQASQRKRLCYLRKLSSSIKQDYNRISKNYDQVVSHWNYKIENSINKKNNPSKFYGFANRKLKANFALPYLKTDSGSLFKMMKIRLTY